MKTAIICYVCNKPRRTSETYKVKMTKFLDTVVEGDGDIVKKVRVCRACAKRMGYKIKVKKRPEKFPANQMKRG